MNGYFTPVPHYVAPRKDDPIETLRKVCNLVAKKDFEDKTVLLECLAQVLRKAGYTDHVDVL